MDCPKTSELFFPKWSNRKKFKVRNGTHPPGVLLGSGSGHPPPPHSRRARLAEAAGREAHADRRQQREAREAADRSAAGADRRGHGDTLATQSLRPGLKTAFVLRNLGQGTHLNPQTSKQNGIHPILGGQSVILKLAGFSVSQWVSLKKKL